jgi:hypothetical protein
MVQISGFFPLVLAVGFLGLAHGFVFSFVMVILGEHHPVDKFQNVSLQVAIVHFFAHIVCGVLIGFVFNFGGQRFCTTVNSIPFLIILTKNVSSYRSCRGCIRQIAFELVILPTIQSPRIKIFMFMLKHSLNCLKMVKRNI